MTALAAITVNDGTDDVIFTPNSIDQNGVAHLYDDEAVFNLRSHLSLGVRLPKNGGVVARVTGKLVIPIPGDDSVSKTGDLIGSFEFVVPNNTTEEHRTRVLEMIKNVLTDPGFEAAVLNLESLY